MRLFIAINFSGETRARLIALRDELRTRSNNGNFTLDDNLHLTLAFIGEVSPKKTDKIKAILDTVSFEPFPVTIERLGTFSRGFKRGARKAEGFAGRRSNDGAGELSRSRGNEQAQSVATWWAGLRENELLMNLQYEVVYKLALCGFEMDRRNYHPHITLGREVVNDGKPWQFEPFGETVTSIDLMKSERIGGNLTYSVIYENRGQE